MDTRTERDTEISTECAEVYEPPMLDEIGGFAAVTCADVIGSEVDEAGYFPG